MTHLGNDWDEILAPQVESGYMAQLRDFLNAEYRSARVYPPKREILAAFEYTSYEDAKVVILGQDPYHGYGQANGLCFSVGEGVACPPSLVNIYREIDAEYGHHANPTGNLTNWQRQGVLLLNNVLTVEAHRAGSHRGHGWETFTEAVIRYLNDQRPHLVFLLWGRDARNKKPLIDASRHLILESPHPSPLSAHSGFFGNNHFRPTNQFLEQHDLAPIEW